MPSLWQRQKKVIIAIVVIAILAVGAVSAALLLRPPSQFTIPLWYNSDGHYGDTEPTVAQVIASAIERTGKINVQLKSEPWITGSLGRLAIPARPSEASSSPKSRRS